MVRMVSDHRCVMATFMITMLGKTSVSRIQKKQDTIEYDERDQAKKLKL